jgi:hypothetical protein
MSLAVTGIVVAGIGVGISAYSAIQAGNAQQAASDYQAQVAANNATIASYNANAAIATGNQQLQAAQEQAAQHQGMIRAAFGAGGIDLDSGSSLRDQQGVAQVDTLNQETITSNAARSAWNFQNQGSNFSSTAMLDTQTANNASTASYMSSFSSLLGGAGTMASQYSKINTPVATGTPTG